MGLILTRDLKKSKILIGDDIVIEIIGVVGKQVRIHIDAPASVSVDREELRLRKETGIDERDAHLRKGYVPDLIDDVQPTNNDNVHAREILRLNR